MRIHRRFLINFDPPYAIVINALLCVATAALIGAWSLITRSVAYAKYSFEVSKILCCVHSRRKSATNRHKPVSMRLEVGGSHAFRIRYVPLHKKAELQTRLEEALPS